MEGREGARIGGGKEVKEERSDGGTCIKLRRYNEQYYYRL